MVAATRPRLQSITRGEASGMKRTLLAAAITLAFSAEAHANPANTATTVPVGSNGSNGGGSGTVTQTATTETTQSGAGPQANEQSVALQNTETRAKDKRAASYEVPSCGDLPPTHFFIGAKVRFR